MLDVIPNVPTLEQYSKIKKNLWILRFPHSSHKHATKWTSYTPSPLGVNSQCIPALHPMFRDTLLID